jgi:phosphoribosylanthranilate isomerase
MGLVFFAKSPRNVSLRDRAGTGHAGAPGLAKVALTVDADDAMLDALMSAVPLDMMQLHGSESPERVAEVRARTGLPVMKAHRHRGGGGSGADRHLFRGRRPAPDRRQASEDATLPGGNGLSFDWRLLAGRKYWTKPWMLAGGLTPDNVAEAVRLTGARQVDLSSGIESAPGVKDPAKMRAFAAAVAGL